MFFGFFLSLIYWQSGVGALIAMLNATLQHLLWKVSDMGLCPSLMLSFKSNVSLEIIQNVLSEAFQKQERKATGDTSSVKDSVFSVC